MRKKLSNFICSLKGGYPLYPIRGKHYRLRPDTETLNSAIEILYPKELCGILIEVGEVITPTKENNNTLFYEFDILEGDVGLFDCEKFKKYVGDITLSEISEVLKNGGL